MAESQTFLDDTLAAEIMWHDYFTATPPPSGDTVYQGAAGWSARYKGARSDAALYFGAKVLR